MSVWPQFNMLGDGKSSQVDDDDTMQLRFKLQSQSSEIESITTATELSSNSSASVVGRKSKTCSQLINLSHTDHWRQGPPNRTGPDLNST